MDHFYDTEKAKKVLEDYTELRKDAPEAGPRLAELAEMNNWPDSVRAVETGVPNAWRLVISDQDELEEIVFRIQGIVVSKDLPPMLNRPSRNVKVGHLRQSITLTGLGNPAFENAVCGVGVVDSQFRRHIDDRRVEETNIQGTFRGYASLELANRYFTAKGAAKKEEPVAFNQMVDPKGILQSLAGSTHLHLAENRVEFQQRKVNQQGEPWFEEVSPSNITVGDVVEVQASFLAVQTGKDKYRTVGVLRCVTLLDSSITEDANKQRRRGEPTGRLKRKTGHLEEMAAQARAKQARIDGQHRGIAEGQEAEGVHGLQDQEASLQYSNEGGDVSMEKAEVERGKEYRGEGGSVENDTM